MTALSFSTSSINCSKNLSEKSIENATAKEKSSCLSGMLLVVFFVSIIFTIALFVLAFVQPGIGNGVYIALLCSAVGTGSISLASLITYVYLKCCRHGKKSVLLPKSALLPKSVSEEQPAFLSILTGKAAQGLAILLKDNIVNKEKTEGLLKQLDTCLSDIEVDPDQAKIARVALDDIEAKLSQQDKEASREIIEYWTKEIKELLEPLF